MEDIVIVGSGGFAREVKWLIDRINSAEQKPYWNFLGYIDSNVDKDMVIGNDDYLYSYPERLSVAIAVGDGGLRRRLARLFKGNSMLCFPNLVDPDAVMSEDMMGEGNIICAGSIMTIGIKIGDFCIINLGCTIGHESVVDNFVTINPGVNVSGNVHLSEGTNIGTGSQIIQGRCVGAETVVGAGAVVTMDIPENCTAVGVPARVIKSSSAKKSNQKL